MAFHIQSEPSFSQSYSLETPYTQHPQGCFIGMLVSTKYFDKCYSLDFQGLLLQFIYFYFLFQNFYTLTPMSYIYKLFNDINRLKQCNMKREHIMLELFLV